MIKYLFFDVGSTLVNEDECIKYRINKSIENTNINYDDFYNEMITYYAQNKNGYNVMIEKYHLKKTPWPSFLETEIDGVKDVLSFYKQKYRLAVIANQPLGTEERLKEKGLLDYFEFVISSAEVGLEKPNPEIFKLALSEAKISADEAYMIGDKLDNDMTPAINLGLHTVWIKYGEGGHGDLSLLSKKPDYVINHIKELIKLDI